MKYLLAVVLLSCSPSKEKPRVIYMPDMVYTPAVKAQSEQAQVPPEGTVSQDYAPYAYSNDPDTAGKMLKNPLQPTAEVLARGQHVFSTYCTVCHGPKGEGDGTIVPKFPRPPSLQSDKIRTYTDGRIYHVIVSGQNLMPSYASQVAPLDRWALIHYIRVLQRAERPLKTDLPKE